MKKEYNSPIVKTFQLKTKNSLLIVSGEGKDVTSVSVSNSSYDSTKGGVLGRGGIFFDEDEE